MDQKHKKQVGLMHCKNFSTRLSQCYCQRLILKIPNFNTFKTLLSFCQPTPASETHQACPSEPLITSPSTMHPVHTHPHPPTPNTITTLPTPKPPPQTTISSRHHIRPRTKLRGTLLPPPSGTHCPNPLETVQKSHLQITS